jgi:hypothetical protein
MRAVLQGRVMDGHGPYGVWIRDAIARGDPAESATGPVPTSVVWTGGKARTVLTLVLERSWLRRSVRVRRNSRGHRRQRHGLEAAQGRAAPDMDEVVEDAGLGSTGA